MVWCSRESSKRILSLGQIYWPVDMSLVHLPFNGLMRGKTNSPLWWNTGRELITKWTAMWVKKIMSLTFYIICTSVHKEKVLHWLCMKIHYINRPKMTDLSMTQQKYQYFLFKYGWKVLHHPDKAIHAWEANYIHIF